VPIANTTKLMTKLS